MVDPPEHAGRLNTALEQRQPFAKQAPCAWLLLGDPRVFRNALRHP